MENDKYKTEKITVNILSVAFFASLVIFIAVCEYILMTPGMAKSLPAFSGNIATLLRGVFSVISVFLIFYVYNMKGAIARGKEGFYKKMAVWMVQNQANGANGSPAGTLVTLFAAAESIGVLGMAMFLLTGGSRFEAYPFFMISFIAMLLALPKGNDLDAIIKFYEENKKPVTR